MGLPARTLTAVTVPVRSSLRAASSGMTTSSRASSRTRALAEAECRRRFRFICIAIFAMTCFGLARVTLAVKAAEACIDTGRLQMDIKAERLTGDTLEADRSALATPSRIEAVAGATMNMSAASDVSYLALPSNGQHAITNEASLDTPGLGERLAVHQQASGARGFVTSLVEMAAGEAQVLLVGDAGLASTR